MKNILLVALTVFLVPTSFAQTEYKQRTYVFSESENIEGDHLDECMQGIKFIANQFDYHGINPNFAFKNKIFSIKSSIKTGKVVDRTVNEIGEILICQDWQSRLDEGIAPAYFEITIGKAKYRAAGAGTTPLVPDVDPLPGGGRQMTPSGYPEPGVANLSYTATVFPAISGRKGGMLYIGNLGYIDGTPTDYFNHFSMAILQVTHPQ